MKPLVVAAALFVAALPASTFAQEEESPTPAGKLSLRATEPSTQEDPIVSVPSEESSGNYPRPGTPLSKPTPATSKSPSPSPAAVATKAPSGAKSSSPKTASPAPGPSATTPKAAAAAVKEMENKWLAALQGHDATAVDALVSDNYIGVTSTGHSANKAALLANIKRDKNKYDPATTNVKMDVRIHGDAAVVVGTTRQVGQDEGGKAFTYYYRWTDTWALRNGQWLCVASQSIQVPK